MGQKVQLAVKRLFDMLVSLAVLVLFSPVWLIVAALIKVTSRGPVFFVQERPGKDRKLIQVYKFRSMRLGSERMVKGQEVMRNDDRVTAVGRFIRRTNIVIDKIMLPAQPCRVCAKTEIVRENK